MTRTVLITGGTGGIGLAMAQAFQKRGDQVVVCARSQASLDRVSTENAGIVSIRADITKAADQEQMLHQVTDRFGRLDVLVNNAGTYFDRDFTAGSAVDGLDAEVALNLTAPIQLTSESLHR